MIMLFLNFLIWGTVVVDPGPPPAVGVGPTDVLARKYIDVVRNTATVVWEKFMGSVPGWKVEETAKVTDGILYKTLLSDGTKQITLLAGNFSNNVADSLKYFHDLYNEKFPKSTVPGIQFQSSWKDCVIQGRTLPVASTAPQLTEDQKKELRQHVLVTQEEIADAMKKANTTTVVLHFVNSSLGLGSGQDPAVHALFGVTTTEPGKTKGNLELAYQAVMESRQLRGLAPSETVVVRMPKNVIQKPSYPSYVLGNAAPSNAAQRPSWPVHVDSVITAIETVLESEGNTPLTVFLGAHGCGIFGNPAASVAGFYYDALLKAKLWEKYPHLKIVFPIMDDYVYHNFSPFADALGQK